ncbi:Dip2/Utp12 family-domain-containing protein [Mycena vulgaris]|nr:Dip2/Utp12 family-domain-containing protein [Mycena vulgaris]
MQRSGVFDLKFKFLNQVQPTTSREVPDLGELVARRDGGVFGQQEGQRGGDQRRPHRSRGDESDLEDRLDVSLPGASKGTGDMSIRRYRQEARTKCVRFSPTGRAWAAASTEGLLIYSLDDTVTFNPFNLSMDLTPQAVLDVLAAREYLKALVMAFRLNEKPLIHRVYESVPRGDIRLVARQLPVVYVPLLLRFVAEHLARSPHLEFDLLWANTLLMAHGRHLRDRSAEYASVFRVLQKGLADFEQSISRLCEENISTLAYLLDQSKVKHAEGDVDMVAV